jgi:multidrug efflux pump subunit AcrA (membrane-fusion protein)
MKYAYLFYATSLVVLVSCGNKAETRPERKDIVDAVFASGHTENFDQYTITANTDGFVAKAFVKEGDTVKAGQLLFRVQSDVQQTQVRNAYTNLDFALTNADSGSPQIQQLKLQIAQAREKLAVDSTNYQRYSRLVGSRAVSLTDFDNAQLNFTNSRSSLAVLEKNLADLQRNLKLNVDNAQAQYDIQRENDQYNYLVSQAGGVVMNVGKKTGDYVKKGDPIATLGTGSVIIKLDIAEDDIRRVRVGQRTLISLNSSKEETFKATITKIYPAFNTTDQSFVAEASFDTVPPMLLNGTQLQANIIIGTKKDALIIPSWYLVNDRYVYTSGSREKRSVETGIRTLEWTEVTRGLNEKDVITEPKH